MKNATVIRIPLSSGNYATLSNKILLNSFLSGDAVRLITILLNNAEDWELNLGYYSNLFGWSKNHQSKIIKELETNGYLKKVKNKSMGKGIGFKYQYTITEIGDLKKEYTSSGDSIVLTTSNTEPKSSIFPNDNKTNNNIETMVNEDDIFNILASKTILNTKTESPMNNDLKHLSTLLGEWKFQKYGPITKEKFIKSYSSQEKIINENWGELGELVELFNSMN